MLWQRVLTALPLAALAIWFILTQSTDALLVALLLITLVAGWEWANLAGITHNVARIAYAIALVVAVYLTDQIINSQPAVFDWFMLIVIIWWLFMIYRMVTRGPSVRNQEISMNKIFIGILTLVPAVIALLHMHAAEQNGPYWLFYALSIIWIADIGAYFSGKRFGKNKLAPLLSPGKTKEGLYGAIVATTLYTLIAAYYFELGIIQTLMLMIIAFFATLLSVAGDLFISLQKRERGVKDSGSILPGHGGVLDRIDSITSSAPFFALMLELVILNV